MWHWFHGYLTSTAAGGEFRRGGVFWTQTKALVVDEKQGKERMTEIHPSPYSLGFICVGLRPLSH